MIATLTLGNTVKNIDAAVQAHEAGLQETATKRMAGPPFPKDIAQRVRVVTDKYMDPRYNSASIPNLGPNPAIDIYKAFAQELAALVTQLSTNPTANQLAETVQTLEEKILDISDETLGSSLQMQVLMPLKELLVSNNFDPLDRRTKLQNILSLAAALDQDEIQFLQSVAQSEKSALSADAQKILDHLPSADQTQAAA